MTKIARAACEILRTERPLSSDFREQVAQMIEAFDQCYAELCMTKHIHDRARKPFYSHGFEMAHNILGEPSDE
ncbi:MAG: hypothetical protein ACR2RF_24850 [Geminicoccaceae bacterium]